MLGSVGVARGQEPIGADFRWRTGGPLIAARPMGGQDWHAIKDPSVVFHLGRWHLFCTVRGTPRSHAIATLSFAEWADAPRAEPRLLTAHAGYFCAPQVFYFTPHRRWYLVCQAADPAWGDPPYRPAFATTERLEDPASWSALAPMFDAKPAEPAAWLDFWVICDERAAHLFFTSLDGKMWRCETTLDRFPRGWSAPVLALAGDVFEASHTYRLRGREAYLTLIEAQNGHGWRYYKAYTATRLDGAWAPLAADRDRSFASLANVVQDGVRWTDSISHVELVRAGNDEHLEIDPADLRVVFQGVTDAERTGKGYGDLPWRLGLLESRGSR